MKKTILMICALVVCFSCWIHFIPYKEIVINDDMPALRRLEKVNDRENYIISDTVIDEAFDLVSVITHESYILYKHSSNTIVYIYVISNDQYRKYVLDCNIEQASEIAIEINSDATEVVYSFPAYETVQSIMVSANDSIKESGLYKIMNSERTESGGDLNRRTYQQSVDDLSDDVIIFTVYNEFTKSEITNDSLVFGEYRFKLKNDRKTIHSGSIIASGVSWYLKIIRFVERR